MIGKAGVASYGHDWVAERDFKRSGRLPLRVLVGLDHRSSKAGLFGPSIVGMQGFVAGIYE